MRVTEVAVVPRVLKGVLEGLALLAVEIALELAVLILDVVGAALAGPLPDDGGTGVDPDGCRGEPEPVVARADVDGHLVLASVVGDRAVVLVGVREVLVEFVGHVTAPAVAVAVPASVSVARTPGGGRRKSCDASNLDERASVHIGHDVCGRIEPITDKGGSDGSVPAFSTQSPGSDDVTVTQRNFWGPPSN